MRTAPIFFLLFLVTLVPPALGLGITSRYVLDFEPGKTYNLQLCVNPSGLPTIEFKPTGYLKDQIVIDRGPHTLTQYTCFPYTISIPETIDKQGLVETYIEVKEIPPPDAGGITVLMKATHQIWVMVPYKGTYADVVMQIEPINAGEPAFIKIELHNRGENAINLAHARIDILDPERNQIAQIETDNARAIAPDTKQAITTTWDTTGQPPGLYTAIAHVTYDDKNADIERYFKIGSQDVILREHTTSVYQGGIREFEVTVESLWSGTVKNVQANVHVEGASLFSTLPQDIAPWGTATLKGYLQTDGLSLGSVPVTIILSFEGGEHTYSGEINVTKAPEAQKPAGSAVFPQWMLILGASVGVLLAAIIVLLVIMLKQRRR